MYAKCYKPSRLFQSINFRPVGQNPTTVNTYTDTTLPYIKKKKKKEPQNLIKIGQLAIAHFILDIRSYIVLLFTLSTAIKKSQDARFPQRFLFNF